MTSTKFISGRQSSSLDRTAAIGGRPFETEVVTPCRQTPPTGRDDLWFSPFRDKVRAVRACQKCPFIGRCGYNAVIARAEYGVWGGMSLPGSDSTPENLQEVYTLLLAQFERRRPVELGQLQVPTLPTANTRRRRSSTEDPQAPAASAVA